MKKHLLLGSVLLAAISTFSQTESRLKPTGMINTKLIADIKFGDEELAAPSTKLNPIKPTAFPVRKGAKANALTTWQGLTGSMNIYGVSIPYCKPLQWNDELNAVSFVHRKAFGYNPSPTPAQTAATGAMVAHVTLDCGDHWDSTAIFANDNFWGRYPNGAIYNPPMTPPNTDINNTYIVGAGPTTGASTGWVGNWYASKKLGTANYNNAPSTVPNAVQVMPTGAPFSANVPSRHDFSAYAFTATDDGKMRILAGITNDATMSDTAVMLMTGTFNSSTSTFDWAGKVFDPPTTMNSDGTENWTSRPIMAWNELGTIGYVVIMGSKLGATNSNVGIQPIVYKTTNSGATWNLETSMNFNLPAYNDLKNRIWGVSTDSTLKVPNFNWLEGMDCSVDANNKLHIFTSILGHSSNNPDSLHFVSQWGTEKYLWPHEPGRMPYLWDFIYDGTNSTPTWSHMLIDSMSTEGPGQRTTDAGYQDNPWDMDPATSNQKIRLDARIQMSRTPDGQHLLYTWTESDVAFTNNQKNWNNLPNIKARLYDVSAMSGAGALSPTKLDLTADATGEIANRAMFDFVSPKFKFVSQTTTTINIMVPITISNSNPYAQLTANTHWYSCAALPFARPASGVGIAENTANSANNSSIYPNPAKNNATVRVDLVSSSKVQIEVLNTVGQVVKTIQSQGQTGANSINVDLNGLSSGIYFVNIAVDNAHSTKKLVIE